MEATTVLTTSQLQRKSPSTAKKHAKQSKKKTKPIKVRYISNPMKVETCASKFRELVQELTGQDAADLPPEQLVSAAEDSSPVTGSVAVENPMPEGHQEPYDGYDRVSDYFEPLDDDRDVYVPHMSDSFSGCFTNGFYNVNAIGSFDSV